MGLVQQFDSGGLRAPVVRIGIRNRDVDPSPTGVAAMQVLGALRFDQHHPVAVHGHRMID